MHTTEAVRETATTAPEPEAATGEAELLRRVGAFEAAGETVRSWMAGANALALLRGALAAGVLDAARTPRTADELATATGIAPERMGDLCTALAVHGILTRDGERYTLAPDFVAITDPDGLYSLESRLGIQRVQAKTLDTLGTADRPYTTLDADDLLAIAHGVTYRPDSSLYQGLSEMFFAGQAPEMHALLRAGGRHLEVGCGVGGGLLAWLLHYPKVTAVGVEINARVIAETRQRAVALGVADRVTLRHIDARDLSDDAVYDTAFWSQSFFPAESRNAVLTTIFRAMKPGGYVVMPSFAPGEPPRTEAEWHSPSGRAFALGRLVYTHWDIPPFAADDLRAELEGAGFAFIRFVPFGTMQCPLARRPRA